MNSMDYWRLCDDLTVVQTALLIVDKDPAVFQESVLNSEPQDRPNGFDAAFAALTNDIRAERIRATIYRIEEPRFDVIAEQYTSVVTEDPDWILSTIPVEEIKKWLISRGITTGFFFPGGTNAPAYLDRSHPRYAPKLAAAVRAWQAMEDDNATRGRSVKQALSKWLREHAAEFRLSDDDGKPNESGIEMCAKVANWQEKGGAPKTPTE